MQLQLTGIAVKTTGTGTGTGQRKVAVATAEMIATVTATLATIGVDALRHAARLRTVARLHHMDAAPPLRTAAPLRRIATLTIADLMTGGGTTGGILIVGCTMTADVTTTVVTGVVAVADIDGSALA